MVLNDSQQLPRAKLLLVLRKIKDLVCWSRVATIFYFSNVPFLQQRYSALDWESWYWHLPLAILWGFLLLLILDSWEIERFMRYCLLVHCLTFHPEFIYKSKSNDALKSLMCISPHLSYFYIRLLWRVGNKSGILESHILLSQKWDPRRN